MSYVYYSYEEWGRGYIGVRKRDAEGDDSYFGSFRDKTFKPTHKIVLAEFDNYKDALQAEVDLHKFYDVGRNPHFANIARSTSVGFSLMGHVHSEETRRLISENNYSRTEESKERKRGDNNPMRRPEVAAKCKGNKSRTGMTNSLEMRRRQSEGSRGHKKSEETRRRMSEAARKRWWITDGTSDKHHPSDLPIPEGWRRGRVR